ncbi:restriction endonuclease subunit S [Aliarcobacter cibarius]|uniref:Type I restriction modification DNA specificity domain-containing protein n=1 Tax=Aliarcobacter cibarius TaxID=255507 RepID=A0ABY2V1H8_9BACT|nr:restriction endonuclease subunit S [Aliarcobacter cibarius]TLS95522.1 hypothetical protein FE247_10995 [Aliarcobacter cibarius]TLS95999.1 hypothetical protein FE245_11085 [Aliarcobacter cibarius]
MSNVPKLRFKEFSGEWEENNLKKLSELITKGTTPKKFSNSGITFVKIEGINNLSINKDKCLFIDENTHNKELKRSILKEQDILFAIAGSLGKVAVVTKNILPANTNQALSIIRLKNKDYLNYILFVLQSRRMKKYIYKNLSVGAQPNLSLEQIGNFNFFLPLKQEQEKIASFLTSVDTRIKQLTKKEELLQQYKKSIMQKIFNQEIRFRADDESEFCEWEEKKLGDILDYIQPTKYLVKDTEYNDSYIIPVLTAGKTFILGYTNETDGVFENNLPVIIFDDFTTANKFVNFPFKAKSSAMKILVSKNNNNIKFIYEAMQMIKYEVGGHERHWISKFSFLNIFIPCIEEQTKIANFLSSIDSKIEKVKKQLNSTKEFKKALLQQMFV